MGPGKLRALTSTGVLLGVLAAFVLAGVAEARTSLSLTKTLRRASGANPVLILRLQATNRGAKAARAAKITTVLPAATRFSSASRGCAPSAAHTVTCYLGTIPGRGKVTVTIVLAPTGVPTSTVGGTVTRPGVPLVPTLSSLVGTTTLTSPDAPAAVVRAPFVLPACTSTITGSVTGSVVVHPGETVCIVDATVHGSVIVLGGGGLSISNSNIIGSITSRGATFVSICGPTAGPYVPAAETAVGSVSISNTTGPVTIGSPAGCAPNVIGGSLTLRSNRGGTTVFGNTIGAGVSAITNVNGLLIGANNITASLVCHGNVPPPTNGGTANNVGGAATGQCAGL